MLAVDADRVSTHFRRPSDWSRILYYLGVQYGPRMREHAGEVGTEAVLAALVGALGL